MTWGDEAGGAGVHEGELALAERPVTAAEAWGRDEAELVAAAQRNRAAFAPLYALYARPVYRYCYRRLGSHEAAEDATSQTFVKALAGLDRFAGTAFRGWLYTIADRVVTDLYRRTRPQAEMDEALDLFSHDPEPEDAAIVAETGRTLQTMISQLTLDQQRVVALRLAGLTGPEIAAVLGRDHQAVKSLQFRAYRRLRELLSEDMRLT
jgi:RNA polymerase sigma-70 factor (ECF subfamily)